MDHKIEKSKKKKMNKKVIIPVAAFAALVAISGMIGVSKANDSEKQETLIQKITEKFNLNQGEVEDVFNQHREERHQQRQTEFEEKLNQAVADGKISEEQKNLILNKREELQGQRESFRDLSPEERKVKKTEHREELEKWAEENNIDIKEFMLMGKNKGLNGEGRGYGGGRGYKAGLHNN